MISYEIRKYRNGSVVAIGNSVLSELQISEKLGAILKETNSLTTARLVSGYNPDEV